MRKLLTVDSLREDMMAIRLSPIANTESKKCAFTILGLIDGSYGSDMLEQDWCACERLEILLNTRKKCAATEILDTYLHPKR